jgi:hypothetical protein
MMSHIEQLHEAIHRMHGCESVHIDTIPVKDVFWGRVVWEGEVELFELSGSQTARQCYAWSQPEDDGTERYFAMLKLPPVTSAETAVRAAIVSELKNRPGG